jgi:hypothetical protein
MGDRKERLFAFACCRSVWNLLSEEVHRTAILVAERHTDGLATDAELGAAVALVHRYRRKRSELDRAVYDAVRYPRGGPYVDAGLVAGHIARVIASVAAPNPSPTERVYWVGDEMIRERPPPNADRLLWNTTTANCELEQAKLVRDIFGNPFRPAAFDPRWGTGDIVALARGIYEDRAFDRLPLLVDALMDAGCDNEDVLAHCRSDGPHVRGCWVLDLVLGKE